MRIAPALTLLASFALAAVSSCAPAHAPVELGVPARETARPGRVPDEFRARVKRALAGYADVADIPSVSVAVVDQGGLVYAASVGYANRAQHRPATPDTPYFIASVTKVFTATLALMMASNGELDLDAPVSDYLPDTVRVPTDADGRQITSRHLLSHSAGLPKNPPNRRDLQPLGPINPGIWDTYSVQDLYDALAATRLEAAVGERFEYSNYGYALLGHVVESAAGTTFENLLRTRILDPLGMSDTAITLTPDLEQRLAAFYWGDDRDRTERAERARFGEVAAFIGLTSTVNDLASFVAAYLRCPDGAVPIPCAGPQRIGEPFAQVDEDSVLRYEVGLGWFRLSRIDGTQTVLLHPGEVDGHTSSLLLLPSEGLGVIVLQNLGGGEAEAAAEQIGIWLLRTASEELSGSHGSHERPAGSGPQP
ncbi:MAG: serine hydrolase domain-containing protein [Planctomycetota bacterium]|nr:serine hydrolase domain-containing protein [Planctomycetota bacterium]